MHHVPPQAAVRRCHRTGAGRRLTPTLLVILLLAPTSSSQKTTDQDRRPEPVQPPSAEARPTPPESRASAESDRALSPDTVLVTATRGPRPAFELPRSVNVADRVDLERKARIVALDAMDEEIGVWVEKRNVASSDPVIRGLSGANILALVDGDSLTTLWGEGGYAGDDLYGKVEAESVERIEIVRGPSSVLYGSNALGGVIQFFTLDPPLDYTSSGLAYGGRLKSIYQSASDSMMGRVDLWGATPRARWRVGYTLRDVEDVRGGGEDGILSPSGVEDANLDLSSEFYLAHNRWLEVRAQSVRREDLARFYRPTQTNDNDRDALSIAWRAEDLGFAEWLRWSAYVQHKEDVREWIDQPKRGVARWDTLASDLQARTRWAEDHLLTWGVHWNVDDGESPDDEQFTITTPATGEQKAAPDSEWEDMGVYLQDEWELGQDWTLTASARLDRFRFVADDNIFWTNPGSTAPENVPRSEPGTYTKSIPSGGIGLVRHLTDDWNVFGSLSRGYRLFPPGFGLRQVGYGVLAPTDGFLDPITGDQIELGTHVRSEGWRASIAGYYTSFDHFQQPRAGTWNGISAIDIDGSGTIEPDEQIYVVTDEATANVMGVEVDGEFDLGSWFEPLEGWSWYHGFMWNWGDVDFGDRTEPLRHTHPARYLTKLRWEDDDPTRGRWFELSADFVDAFDRVSASRLTSDVGYLNDPQDPTSGLVRPWGLPGYAVFDLRGGVELARDVTLTVALENLFDRRYRPAHSRMDAPGRSAILALEVSF